jgi:hypothetical protein
MTPSQNKNVHGLVPQPYFHGLGCSHFACRYYGNRFCFLFLWLLRCFSSPGCLLPAHGFSRQFKRLTYLGISKSMLIFNSPKHFIACYALPHLVVPRYPPQAFPLLNLTINVKTMLSYGATKWKKDLINIHECKIIYRTVELLKFGAIIVSANFMG